MNNHHVSTQILNAVQTLNPAASLDDLRTAFKRILEGSDLVNCTQPPFTDAELELTATKMFEHILNPSTSNLREIAFETVHPLVGASIDCDEFALRFSADFLSQQIGFWSSLWYNQSLPISPFHKVIEFFAVILFRYSYCVRTDMAVFPVSFIMTYLRAVSDLFAIDHREDDTLEAMHATLLALQSCEPPGYA